MYMLIYVTLSIEYFAYFEVWNLMCKINCGKYIVKIINITCNNIRKQCEFTYFRNTVGTLKLWRGCRYSPGLLVSHRLCSLVKRRKTSGGTVLVNFVSWYKVRETGSKERRGAGRRAHLFRYNSQDMILLNVICQLIGSTLQSVTIRRSSRYLNIHSCDDILHNVTFFSFWEEQSSYTKVLDVRV